MLSRTRYSSTVRNIRTVIDINRCILSRTCWPACRRFRWEGRCRSAGRACSSIPGSTWSSWGFSDRTPLPESWGCQGCLLLWLPCLPLLLRLRSKTGQCRGPWRGAVNRVNLRTDWKYDEINKCKLELTRYQVTVMNNRLISALLLHSFSFNVLNVNVLG